MAGPVVVLAGGTGGAKLARGMLDVVGDDLVVVANTGDDLEIYGSHVSPDPDLIAFWLADRIDERGWGLEGDTFAVMDALRALGEDVWFNLGDADLAWCLQRARRMREGETATAALAALTAAIGVRARVLPMCDTPVRTRVHARGSWTGLQEFLIRQRGEGPVEDVAFDGAEAASISDEVADALARAEAIVIGPSNPIISIRPILSVPGMTAALRDAPGAGRRDLADRRGPGAEGPDRRVHAVGRPAADLRGHRRAVRRRRRRAARRRGRRGLRDAGEASPTR